MSIGGHDVRNVKTQDLTPNTRSSQALRFVVGGTLGAFGV